MGGSRGSCRAEAARIAMKQKTGTIGVIMDQTPPKPLRNHVRDNVRELRELARDMRNKRSTAEEAACRPKFKLRQFENIPSRVTYDSPQTNASMRSSSTPSSPPYGNGAFGSRVPRGLSDTTPSTPSSPPYGNGAFGSRVPRGLSDTTPSTPSRPSSAGRISPASPPQARPSSAGRPSPTSPPQARPSSAGRLSPSSPQQARPYSAGNSSPPPQARPPSAVTPQPRRRGSFGGYSSPRGKQPPKVVSSSPWPARECADDGTVNYCDDFDLQELEQAAARLRRQAAAPRRGTDNDAGGYGQIYHQDYCRPKDDDGSCLNGGHGVDDIPIFVPPGYRLMPEKERVETLESLRQKLSELDEAYARLPLRIETEGHRRQQQQLREKIAETEDAVNLFSRPQVLVEI